VKKAIERRVESLEGQNPPDDDRSTIIWGNRPPAAPRNHDDGRGIVLWGGAVAPELSEGGNAED